VVEKLKFRFIDITGIGFNEFLIASKYADIESYTAVMSFLEEEVGCSDIRDTIVKHALDHNIPVLTAVSLAWQESRYNSLAINRNSSSTDYGLFQLNSKTFSTFTSDQLFDIDTNTKEAMTFLNYLILRFESWDMALVAYNAGPSAVVNRRIPWTTFNHVTKINSKIAELEKRLFDVLIHGS
jgi:soluble lytic murein transglycosylase-like protein